MPRNQPVRNATEFNGCYAKWNEHELLIGNRKCERKWSIGKGLLTATSFRNLGTGTEWLRQAAKHPGSGAR